MKVCCLSDIHGSLPSELPDCDVVLIAGDICHDYVNNPAVRQIDWLDQDFRRWLNRVNKPVFACAGNHDWCFYEYPERVARLQLPWTYLQDESAEFKGLRLWGTPWQRKFYDWAFNLTESELMGKWNFIPDNTDILICHSPPKFYGDKNRDGELCGSESLTWRIMQVKPKLVIFGHIHDGRGIYHSGDTILVNATIGDGRYGPIPEPFVVEI